MYTIQCLACTVITVILFYLYMFLSVHNSILMNLYDNYIIKDSTNVIGYMHVHVFYSFCFSTLILHSACYIFTEIIKNHFRPYSHSMHDISLIT